METTTIKTRLKTVLSVNPNAPNPISRQDKLDYLRIINDLVPVIRDITVAGSRIANAYVLYCFERNEPIPKIDKSFYQHCFNLVKEPKLYHPNHLLGELKPLKQMQKRMSEWFMNVWRRENIEFPAFDTSVKIGEILGDYAADAAQSAQAIVGQRYAVIRIKYLQSRLKELDTESLIANGDYIKLATHLFKRLSNQQTVWPYSVRQRQPVNDLLARLYRQEHELAGIAAYNVKEAHRYLPNMIRSLRLLEEQLAATQMEMSRPDESLPAPTRGYILRKLKKLETHPRISNRAKKRIVRQIQDAVKFIVARYNTNNFRRWDWFCWNWSEIYQRFPFRDVTSDADLNQIHVWIRKISVKIIVRNFKPKKFATERGRTCTLFLILYSRNPIVFYSAPLQLSTKAYPHLYLLSSMYSKGTPSISENLPWNDI